MEMEKFNILVCDDEKSIVDAIEIYLKQENYNIIKAYNGEEALHALEQNEIHLILLDIMMPGMDGYAFAELLRDCNNDIPILMLSAKQLPEDVKKGFLSGTDDYMTKPVDEAVMLLRIKALLRRAKIISDRRLTIGSTVLDYDTMTVRNHESSHLLPQKEFQLLYKLL